MTKDEAIYITDRLEERFRNLLFQVKKELPPNMITGIVSIKLLEITALLRYNIESSNWFVPEEEK